MPIGMDSAGNVVHMPYTQDQGQVPTSYNKLEGTDVAMDSGIKAQERALVELAVSRMGGTPEPYGVGE